MFSCYEDSLGCTEGKISDGKESSSLTNDRLMIQNV